MLFSKLVSIILWEIAYVVSLLPLRLLYFVSDVFFYPGYYIAGYRRSVIIQNLSRSFPEKKYHDIRFLSKEYTRYLFRLFAEWLKLVSISEKSLNRRIQYKNLDLLRQYSENGQSVFLVMGHYGNWENLTLLSHHLNYPVYAVYKKQSNTILNDLGIRLRSRFGVKLLEKKEASRFILKNREIPGLYVFIADQSPSPSNKVVYSFLNQPTSAFAGVEKLAASTNAAVVYVEVMHTQEGNYSVNFSDISTSDSITTKFLSLLEQSINKAPQYWLWSHKRWKHNIVALDDII